MIFKVKHFTAEKNRRRDLRFSEDSLFKNFHSAGLWLGCMSSIYEKNIHNGRFLGNFAKFFRIATLQNICELLLLRNQCYFFCAFFKPLNDNSTKWSNTLKQLFDCVWPFRGVGAWRFKKRAIRLRQSLTVPQRYEKFLVVNFTM